MRIIKLTLAVLLALCALQPLVHAAESTSVRAILIMASNAKGPADPRLAAFEADLQRNVPESSFRYLGEGSASVRGGERASIPLQGNHRIDLTAAAGGAGLRLRIQWTKGGVPVIALNDVEPGKTFTLGRRTRDDGDVPIVLVITK
jgi:hypothetical protein